MNWNKKRCTESNILTMGHELVLGKSSSAAVYTLPNTIIYLKVVKHLDKTGWDRSIKRILKLRWGVQKIEDRMLYFCVEN